MTVRRDRRVSATPAQFDELERRLAQLQATSPIQLCLQQVMRQVLDAGLKATAGQYHARQ